MKQRCSALITSGTSTRETLIDISEREINHCVFRIKYRLTFFQNIAFTLHKHFN